MLFLKKNMLKNIDDSQIWAALAERSQGNFDLRYLSIVIVQLLD